MPKASPLRSSFNAGELSPLMAGRPDVAKYSNGCDELVNFIPTVQGPAVRRAGTRYVSAVKTQSNRTWLATFEFSNSQAYVLEFGDQYIRFYTNHGQVLSGGSPYEIVSPYTSSDLTDSVDGTFTLSMVQSGDVIYIAHPSYPLRKLSRLGNTNWTMSAVTLTNGPFKTQNSDRSVTMYASATSGSGVTLTASSAVFTSAMVGSYVYLEPSDLSSIKPWTAGQELSTGTSGGSGSNVYGTIRRSDGKTYKCVTSGAASGDNKVWRTGPNKPIHTYGTEADGDGNAISGTTCQRQGLDWQFIDSGFGYVKITAYSSSTSVTVTVQGDNPLPSGVVGSGNATFRWALGSFSAVEGYPSKVTFFRERLALAMGQKLYFSVAGDFENFAAKNDSGEVVADRAIQVTISSDEVNAVQWLVPTQALLIGTAGGEFACSENTSSEAFGPGNVKIEQQTSEGSRSVAPQRVGYSTLFVQRSGRKVKEAAYNFQQNGYVTNDLTILAEHVTKGGIVQTAWHKEPYVAMWAVRTDGELLGFTFNKEQDVLGWHRHIIGGAFGSGDAVVESVAVIPGPNRDRDDLWVIVKRTINGSTKRYVEYLEAEYKDGDAQSSAFYVDSGATYSGSPVTTISGLTWLEGQEVQILADGAAHPNRTVTSGAVTLQRSASVVQVGLPFESTLRTTRIDAGAGDGTSQGKTKRITKVTFRFYNTLGAKVGPDETLLDRIEFRTGSDLMDQAPPLFTGDKGPVDWPGGYDFDGFIMVKQDQPLPMTVVAIMPQVHTFDR
jgi:hypothetical protein